jgi:hypothetical protein
MGVSMSDNDGVKKLSEEDRKRLMTQLQKDIKFYEDLEESRSQSGDLHLQRIDFTKALLYGIFYGIMGNLSVQYSFPVYEGLALGRFDSMFWISVLVFVVSVAVIIITAFKLNRELKEEKRLFDVMWTDKIASKWTKEDLKRLLDYLKNQ